MHLRTKRPQPIQIILIAVTDTFFFFLPFLFLFLVSLPSGLRQPLGVTLEKRFLFHSIILSLSLSLFSLFFSFFQDHPFVCLSPSVRPPPYANNFRHCEAFLYISVPEQDIRGTFVTPSLADAALKGSKWRRLERQKGIMGQHAAEIEGGEQEQ